MGKKDKPKRPKAARGAPALPSAVVIGAGVTMIVAAGAAMLWASRPPERVAALTDESTNERMAVRSEGDEEDGRAAVACSVLQSLWEPPSAESERLGCAGFLRRHWEIAPRLTRPGPAWTGALMGITDVRRMVSTWPFRIHKNHG
eukprot:2475620-Prymnesium_polylepis.1